MRLVLAFVAFQELIFFGNVVEASHGERHLEPDRLRLKRFRLNLKRESGSLQYHKTLIHDSGDST